MIETIRSLKVDFFADGSEDCPILQISGTNLETSRELFHAIRPMRDSLVGSFALHEVQGFEDCGNPEFIFAMSGTDIGVERCPQTEGFRCSLSFEGWTLVEDLLASFCRRNSTATGYQWLNESSDISLLYSKRSACASSLQRCMGVRRADSPAIYE